MYRPKTGPDPVYRTTNRDDTIAYLGLPGLGCAFTSSNGITSWINHAGDLVRNIP